MSFAPCAPYSNSFCHNCFFSTCKILLIARPHSPLLPRQILAFFSLCASPVAAAPKNHRRDKISLILISALPVSFFALPAIFMPCAHFPQHRALAPYVISTTNFPFFLLAPPSCALGLPPLKPYLVNFVYFPLECLLDLPPTILFPSK